MNSSSSPVLLRPAERLLSRFGLSGKIALIGLAFLLVIGLLLAAFLHRELSDIEFSSKEQVGVEAIRPLAGLIQEVQRHRGLRSRLLNGDGTARSGVDESRAKADAAFEAAGKALAPVLPQLNMENEWKALQAGWQGVRLAEASAPTEDFARHSKLVADILAFSAKAADNSNLTLDPDLDSYYLMDAVVVRLPNLVELSAKTRGLASGIATRRQITADEKTELATRLVLFDEHAKALSDGMDKVGSANLAYKESLARAKGDLERAAQPFAAQIRQQFIQSTVITVDGPSVFALGSKTVDAGFALWAESLIRLDESLAARIARLKAEMWRTLAMCLAGALLAAYLFIALRRVVSESANQISLGAQRIAGGDLNTSVDCGNADEFGVIAGALNRMREALLEQIERERVISLENLRVRSALDHASVNLMLADGNGTIIYMNHSVAKMLRAAEPEMKKQIPSFSVDTLVGRSFDDFHRNPAHQRSLIAGLTATHTAQVTLGRYIFRLRASPVVDGGGVRIGTVLEWTDRTAEVAAEAELNGLVEAAVAGDFARRLSLEGKEGFFRQLADSMNRLMGVVANSIEDVARVLNAVARGDLTDRITADYTGTFGQLKDDTNTTVERLREVVSQIKDATEAIDVAAKEIAAGNVDLSGRTEEQASSLEETASSMEELNATVKQNADNARTANELARSSNAVAEAGGQKMQDVVATMSAIQESAKKIADIIGVIDSIAFQTNILALNAAVEAARAGEQGRGFAVVASEVRNLAQRSAQAAKEIKGLIADSVDKVEAGGTLVQDAGQTMNEMVANFQRLAVLVTDIAGASREQSAGIEQVTQAVGQMDEVTQQNAALVEQAAAAAESLQEQAASLVGTVAMFTLEGSAGGNRKIESLDFDGVIHAHMQWKQTLRNYLAGQGRPLDAGVVGRDDKCALGCWIHGDGQRFAQDGDFETLKGRHAEFHLSAAEIIRKADAGDKDGAQALLLNDFSALSDQTVQDIRKLKARFGQGGAALRAVPAARAKPVARSVAAPLPRVKRAASAAPVEDEWESF